jgi:hypothetical protein
MPTTGPENWSRATGPQTGVSGYVYRQIRDDEVNGQKFGDGNRGQVLSIGPFLRYHPAKNWGLTLKWQIEGDARNRTQGNRIFLQFAAQLF